MRIKKLLKPILSAAMAVYMMGSVMSPLPAHALGNASQSGLGGVKLAVSDYTFTGWNTEPDGSGIQYNDRDALDAIGRDSGVSDLTLYANWKTNVTFDSNGGTLTGGTTNAEKKLAGKSDGEIAYSVNQTAATGLLGEKENFTFVQWNTKPDGSGVSIEKYGKITKPVTFYAIYYQSEYYYTGSAQEFIAPVDGWYYVELWGAAGGNSEGNNSYGDGGYVAGEVYITARTKLYVMVGGGGTGWGVAAHSKMGAGWNGGGPAYGPDSDYIEGGGGATDIRTVVDTSIPADDWTIGLSSRIAVAAGGGGSNPDHLGGAGGGWTGGKGYGSPGTQTSGTFGYGTNAGGGGWYGGRNGGGGSSYLSGWTDCVDIVDTGYIFHSGITKVGALKAGHGKARITMLRE